MAVEERSKAAASPARRRGQAALAASLRALTAGGSTAATCILFDLGGQARHGGMVAAMRLVHGAAVSRAGARVLAASLGPAAAPHPLGADAHAVLLDGDEPAQAERIVRAGLAAFASPLRADGLLFPVRAAAGVLVFDPRGMPAEEVLRLTARAALDAQALPGRTLRRAARDTGAMRRTAIIAETLPEALGSDREFALVFQPRVRLTDGTCLRAEALLRWNHPRLGPVSPGEFVPLVEELGLTAEMTAWVLGRALSEAAAWQGAGPGIGVSVNISAANLSEGGFAERLGGLLARYRMPSAWVELELTETAARDGGAQAAATMQALQAMGVALAIDDFGTAYSNLADLRAMPAQVLKIDHSFTRDLPESGRDRAIVEALVGLARRLGYRTCAEGIESADALGFLAGLGCDEGQGLHIARPMPAEALRAWFAAQRPAVHSA